MRRQKIPRRPLPQASEEMKAWSLELANEVSSWPEVQVKPMFGMRAYYRRGRIFACLPHKRAFYEPDAVIFKFDPLPPKLAKCAQNDPRVSSERAFQNQAGWLCFEIGGPDDLRDVLWWFQEAHRAAGLRRPAQKG